MDRKEAYRTLGLTEEASMDEVEKKYELYLRKGKRSAEEEQLTLMNQAYRVIKDYEYKQAIEESRKGQEPWKENLDHIWFHYKGYIIGGILSVLLIASIVYAVVNNAREQRELANLPPASVEVMIYGDFYTPNTDSLEQQLLQSKEEWQRVRTIFSYFPLEARDPYAIAAQQRSVLDLISERPDVFLADPDNFTRLRNQGAIQPLDPWEQEIRTLYDEDQWIYMQDEEDGEPRLYGVIVTESPVLDRVFYEETTIIAGLGIQASNQDNAIEVIRIMAPHR